MQVYRPGAKIFRVFQRLGFICCGRISFWRFRDEGSTTTYSATGRYRFRVSGLKMVSVYARAPRSRSRWPIAPPSPHTPSPPAPGGPFSPHAPLPRPPWSRNSPPSSRRYPRNPNPQPRRATTPVVIRLHHPTLRQPRRHEPAKHAWQIPRRLPASLALPATHPRYPQKPLPDARPAWPGRLPRSFPESPRQLAAIRSRPSSTNGFAA